MNPLWNFHIYNHKKYYNYIHSSIMTTLTQSQRNKVKTVPSNMYKSQGYLRRHHNMDIDGLV